MPSAFAATWPSSSIEPKGPSQGGPEEKSGFAGAVPANPLLFSGIWVLNNKETEDEHCCSDFR
jgi:hypothetical protein